MNERIRELAEQAMIFSSENGGWRISTHVPSDFQEKFAELMVEECCQVLSKETIRHDGYGYNQHALYQILRKHFGVEE